MEAGGSCGFAANCVPSPQLFSNGSPLIRDPLCGATLAMPSIEIACLGLETPASPPSGSFDVLFERGLKSHRSPQSLFQADFERETGCMYHLGSPGFGQRSGPFFAYELLSKASRSGESATMLELHADHVVSAKILLAWLLQQSPNGRLLFTSDWQFGPEAPMRFAPSTLDEFWSQHDRGQLRLNSLYPITRAA